MYTEKSVLTTCSPIPLPYTIIPSHTEFHTCEAPETQTHTPATDIIDLPPRCHTWRHFSLHLNHVPYHVLSMHRWKMNATPPPSNDTWTSTGQRSHHQRYVRANRTSVTARLRACPRILPGTSRYAISVPIRSRPALAILILAIKTKITRLQHCPSARFHSYNRWEHHAVAVHQFLYAKGIKQTFRDSYQPHSNALSERLNRGLIDVSPCHIRHFILPYHFC